MKVILKPGREKSILQRHPWIFSGAINYLPKFENGGFLPVQSSDGKPLGYAYFNKNSNIIGRMVSFRRNGTVSCYPEESDCRDRIEEELVFSGGD